MMNGWASECSSGCESGWTMYLDHSSPSANPRNVASGGFGHPTLGIYGKADDRGKDAKEDNIEHGEAQEEEEEEEDLSMVSDASSGPPHFHQDEDYYSYYDENAYLCSAAAPALDKKSGKRPKVQEYHHQQRHPSSFLDDTASSPIVSLSSKNKLTLTENQASGENVFSHGNHSKGKSSFQKHFSFARPGKSSSAKTSYLQGRGWN